MRVPTRTASSRCGPCRARPRRGTALRRRRPRCRGSCRVRRCRTPPTTRGRRSPHPTPRQTRCWSCARLAAPPDARQRRRGTRGRGSRGRRTRAGPRARLTRPRDTWPTSASFPHARFLNGFQKVAHRRRHVKGRRVDVFCGTGVAPNEGEAMKELSGKVAVVTGGAGGIGKALCEELVAEGAKVVVTDVQEDLLARTTDELAAKGDVIGVP